MMKFLCSVYYTPHNSYKIEDIPALLEVILKYILILMIIYIYWLYMYWLFIVYIDYIFIIYWSFIDYILIICWLYVDYILIIYWIYIDHISMYIHICKVVISVCKDECTRMYVCLIITVKRLDRSVLNFAHRSTLAQREFTKILLLSETYWRPIRDL